ncbi:MAG: hypothetical protein ACT4TC_21045 [Myxococcaceae bacterium]
MKPVVIDTSVWRRHFSGKLKPEQLRWMNGLLDEDGAVLLHPWVIGELVLGGLSSKEEGLLELLPAATELSQADVLGFVRYRKLVRKGIGWVDAQLLASTLTDSAQLWAIDGSLEGAADELKVGFHGPD